MIKRILAAMMAFVLIFSCMPAFHAYAADDTTTASGTTYYVSSLHGAEGNDGTSERTPFASLLKINDITLQPGDRVLLERGSVFVDEYLHITGSGNEDAPIIIDAYGDESQALPLIQTNGNGVWYQDYGKRLDNTWHKYQGNVSSCILLYDVEYIEISNIAMTNEGNFAEGEVYNTYGRMDRTGVAGIAENIGTVDHIYLRNLDIRNVQGSVHDKHMANGGIYLLCHKPDNESATGVARFDDVLIEGCRLDEVNRWGVAVGYTAYWDQFAYGPTIDPDVCRTYGSTNVVIRNNYITNVGGDGITTMYCYQPLIEYNVLDGYCQDMTMDIYGNNNQRVAAGIWPWMCKTPILQFNEAYNSTYCPDAQAWDADWGDNAIYQYNYSCNNAGGAVMFCGQYACNTVFRYNISQYDLEGVLNLASSPNGEIYNNVFYIKEGVKINRTGMSGGWGNTIYNNIFYYTGSSPASATYGNWGDITAEWSNNIYYNYETIPNDAYAITDDPLFVNPGNAPTGSQASGLVHDRSVFDGYKLQENSPAINAGKFIPDAGEQDFFGGQLDLLPDIGAHEAVTIDSDAEVSEKLTIPMGETYTTTDTTGNYVGDALTGLDTNVATVDLTATQSFDYTASAPVTELVSGNTYLILNNRSGKLVTNGTSGNGLLLNGTTTNFDASAVWTIEASGDGYTVKDANGKYLTMGADTASVVDAATTVELVYSNGNWTLHEDNCYMNHLGGGNSTTAGGWNGWDGYNQYNASTDAGSQFTIYSVTAEEVDATEVTITGVNPGQTMVTVGKTLYVITVFDGDAVGEYSYKGPAITVTRKPADGTTVDQPLEAGDLANDNYRIPALTNLNGTIIAAADARWNVTHDCGGLDTIVSVSTDNGKNWAYTYANYIGDNGNTYNRYSTTFIDPALANDGQTAYMIVDLFPAGISTMAAGYPSTPGSSGFDANGNLLLRDLAGDTVAMGGSGYNTMAAAREYNYYLDLETYKIYTKEGVECKAYTVDEMLNISYRDAQGNEYNTHLFMADSPFQVFPCGFLYMTTTTNGLDWSAPKLLNLKNETENAFLLGPGNGIYDAENENMIFCAYSYGNAVGQLTYLIWMDSEGEWHRSAQSATETTWSSEASAVQLEDGTIRVFFRDPNTYLSYTDYQWDAETETYVRDQDNTNVATEAAKNSGTSRNGCQLSAIKYSQKIEGKEAIIVSTPANANSRADGHIYVFLLDENNDMDLAYNYDMTPDNIEYYCYSCLAELNDGTLGLLWESQWGGGNGPADILYTNLTIDDLVNVYNDPDLTVVKVELPVGKTAQFTNEYQGQVDADALATDYVGVDVASEDNEGTWSHQVTLTGLAVGGSQIQIGSTVYDVSVYEPDVVEVTVAVGEVKTITDDTGDYAGQVDASGLDTSIATVDVTGSEAANAMGVVTTPVTALENGTYVILNNRANKLVTNEDAGATSADAGTMSGLRMTGTINSFSAEDAVWTITAVAGGYTIQDSTGKYMTIGSNAASVSETAATVAIAYRSGSWTLCQNNAYLNDAAGAGVNASGWQNASAATDEGSQFTIYRVIEPHTKITVTGVSAGMTDIQVGKTVYKITVGDPVVEESDVTRLSGSGRCETAYLAANELKAALGVEKFDAVIIASGDNFADALAGSYLAAVKGAPILLYRNGYAAKNAEYIAANLKDGGTVYILGGTAAVPEEMETALAGYTVKRVKGANRFETNLAILEEAGVGDKDILVATGYNFADSLSASATGMPILLVHNSNTDLTETQKAFLDELDGNNIVVIGGTGAVNEDLYTALSAYDTEITRVKGSGREATSVALAAKYFEAPATAVVAYSRNFPDGLCGGPLAYALGAPLLLTNAGYEDITAAYTAEMGVASGFVLGGTAAVSDAIVRTVFAMANDAEITVKR